MYIIEIVRDALSNYVPAWSFKCKTKNKSEGWFLVTTTAHAFRVDDKGDRFLKNAAKQLQYYVASKSRRPSSFSLFIKAVFDWLYMSLT